MSLHRRDFLIYSGLGVASSALLSVASCTNKLMATDTTAMQAGSGSGDDWEKVRAQFNLDPNYIHMAGLLLTSHPVPVQEVIEKHQRELNQNPALYLEQNNSQLTQEVRNAAANYMGAKSSDIALTDSTTMGTALIINGLQIRENQEMLTTEFDYYSTHESLRYKAARAGAKVREIPLYQNIQKVSEAEIADTLTNAIRSETRLVTATWVHSSTGLKVPVRRIADRLAEINANRTPSDRVLLFVDGVHGLGVENATMGDLNCDFFTAGTHKWLFAPRGTGIIWGNSKSQAAISPTIPTFTRTGDWGGRMTPGGFKPFEHQWAQAEAFRFHQKLGKSRVQERIYSLSRQLKEGLANMRHITLYTPISENLSSGIVCFDVDNLSPVQVVRQLRQRNIIASDTPYSPSHARLTPGVYNTPQEIEQVLRAIRDLA
ncbi:aminotransferase class V-fold PLP-dependent enzyme [Chlorogloeopsis sp. ULAP01]|uniref:aminotransferase class V-fold PLP-dependent enzyme n=1 Tax=Chlorogloeopsis sp. ULAP01 TaxID=3056483 RepID=UPI0025AB54F9|nr:aminotransferase class V-fold PLP-dependent enzyme [Chlorogloeopsis sp. ULAP01]MDM9381487.1 aminotransferase class V-fold PLP-dependent enzyme [Chlorogloeopsis sp. ULAP01]